MENDVVTLLQLRIAGESGIIANVLQRTGDVILTKAYTGLKIAGMFAEEILIAGISLDVQL